MFASLFALALAASASASGKKGSKSHHVPKISHSHSFELFVNVTEDSAKKDFPVHGFVLNATAAHVPSPIVPVNASEAGPHAGVPFYINGGRYPDGTESDLYQILTDDHASGWNLGFGVFNESDINPVNLTIAPSFPYSIFSGKFAYLEPDSFVVCATSLEEAGKSPTFSLRQAADQASVPDDCTAVRLIPQCYNNTRLEERIRKNETRDGRHNDIKMSRCYKNVTAIHRWY